MKTVDWIVFLVLALIWSTIQLVQLASNMSEICSWKKQGASRRLLIGFILLVMIVPFPINLFFYVNLQRKVETVDQLKVSTKYTDSRTLEEVAKNVGDEIELDSKDK